jgi:hypothetical protein
MLAVIALPQLSLARSFVMDANRAVLHNGYYWMEIASRQLEVSEPLPLATNGFARSLETFGNRKSSVTLFLEDV